eukprot:315438_1
MSGFVADKLYYSMRNYVPPMPCDCVHHDYPFKNANQFTDIIVNEINGIKHGHASLISNKYFKQSGLRYVDGSKFTYAIESHSRYNETGFTWTFVKKYEKWYKMDNLGCWIYGFCKQCIHHLFIKTNKTHSITDNIQNIIHKLHSTDKIKQKYFNALWMNLSLLLSFLLHPTF